MTGGGHHDFILAAYEDYATPPDLYPFSGDFSRKERLSAIDPRLNELPSGKVHYFDSRIPMPGGRIVKITSAVLMPPRPGPQKDEKDAPPPAVVIIYPQSDLTWYASQYGGGFPATVPARALTGRGYAVVLTHVPMPPPGQAVNSLKIITDALLPQIYRAAELGYVDLERLALMGQSYGAYSTDGVLTRTNLFKAAVAISGLYDPAGTYGRFLNDMMFGATYYEDGQGRMGASPWEDPRRYLENSPYDLADRIRTPLLLLQGTEDHLPEESEKMFNALHRLGRTAQLALYDGEGHVIENWRRQNALDATRRIIRIFAKISERAVRLCVGEMLFYPLYQSLAQASVPT
ncbi:alpha/beta hydrolase family protein [Luteithermobacter gelatinilyticus]|uniref:alpha/beta hydrolase family protein n=1 Tax=Luteithermobacter gelatinilyticus TaxID=2582913 RepID=UPI0011073DB2|nr:prolyl oligopeptidase family serine peptidase [Luteithermobacter gelatinilyticus]